MSGKKSLAGVSYGTVPGSAGILNTPGITAGYPANPTAYFTSSIMPATTVYGDDYEFGHLNEELDVPLHTMSERQMLDLADELNTMGWQQKEQDIARVVKEFMQVWRAESNPGTAFQRNVHHVAKQFSVAGPLKSSFGGHGTIPSITNTYKTIQVAVPLSLPPEYVKPFVERMVREQIEG